MGRVGTQPFSKSYKTQNEGLVTATGHASNYLIYNIFQFYEYLRTKNEPI